MLHIRRCLCRAGKLIRHHQDVILASYSRSARVHMIEADDGGLKPKQSVVHEIEDRLVQGDYGLTHNVLREDTKERLKVKYKSIQRKHFKQPYEENLLTWDAKNQIRFLLKEYPETWTIARIVDSFPITRSGVIKVLQSSWTPKNELEIFKHDKRVKQHWLQLKSGKGSGPVSLLYQKLAADGKWDLITNAAGIRTLPKPEHRVFLSGGTHEVERQVGKFESIVKEYCEQKQLEAGKVAEVQSSKVSGVKRLGSDSGDNDGGVEQQNEVQSLLQNISEIWRSKFGSEMTSESREKAASYIMNMNQNNASVSRSSRGLNNDSEVSKLSRDTNFSSSSKADNISQFSSQDANLQTYDHDSEDSEIKPQRQVSRRFKGKLRSRSGARGRKENYDPEIFFADNGEKVQSDKLDKLLNDKVKRNERQENIWKHVKYEKPKGADENVVEPYLYDAYTGYQHPFGKYDPVAEKRKVDGKKRNKASVKNGAYYARDGEFLFKIP